MAEREAPIVAAIDTDEGARVPTKGKHLLEDRIEHQLAQGNLLFLRELHQRAAGVGGDGDDFGVADVGTNVGSMW
ncbi:MAG: hypothetical protein JST08_00385 [Actinobacteria bacterium]|nr:hypothetical protein [Actinomycetota bacterium]